MRRTALYSAAAQDDNLGDAVIRSIVLSWLIDSGSRIELYTGSMSASYLSVLPTPPTVRVHSGVISLAMCAVQASLHRDLALVYAPGPRPTGPSMRISTRALLKAGLPLAIRLIRGLIISPGLAFSNADTPAMALQRQMARHASHVSVRDLASQKALGGIGTLIPDVAFSRAEQSGTWNDSEDRVLAISLRGDQKPDLAVLRALLRSAALCGIRPVLVTQVRRDRSQHDALAHELRIEHVDWQFQTHLEQLERVNDYYRRTRIVYSNRLHSCIFAACHGAVVMNAESVPHGKVSNTLGTVFPSDWLAPISAAEVPVEFVRLLSRSQDSRLAVSRAAAVLRKVRQELVDLLSNPLDPKDVGRAVTEKEAAGR